MDRTKYIGMDVHQASISIAVRDASGKLVMELNKQPPAKKGKRPDGSIKPRGFRIPPGGEGWRQGRWPFPSCLQQATRRTAYSVYTTALSSFTGQISCWSPAAPSRGLGREPVDVFPSPQTLPPEAFFYAPLDMSESTLLKEDARPCPDICFQHTEPSMTTQSLSSPLPERSWRRWSSSSRSPPSRSLVPLFETSR